MTEEINMNEIMESIEKQENVEETQIVKEQPQKFDIESIDKTFASYKKGQLFDGVVVIKREDGVIFNIGGKNDAFIAKEDFEDFNEIKIGDRFKVMIINMKNEAGLIEVSKRDADNLVLANQNAQKLKLGSKFSFVVTSASAVGLVSKLGDYSIFIPAGEVSNRFIKDFKALVGKQYEATVTEIDKDNKKIIGSVKLLAEQIRQTNEALFWSSIFVNKVVEGKVKKIMPYGCFVDVDGVDAFVHISNLSYERVNSPEEVVKEGEVYSFKVIELDRDNKKVSLSKKALEENPKVKGIKELVVGQEYNGKVVKILAFGAIIKLENGVTGLLHISNATQSNTQQIYEVVKLDQEVQVEVIDIDLEEQKVSFKIAGLAKDEN